MFAEDVAQFYSKGTVVPNILHGFLMFLFDFT